LIDYIISEEEYASVYHWHACGMRATDGTPTEKNLSDCKCDEESHFVDDTLE